MSTVCTRTFPCFAFMRGDYQAICSHFRSLDGSPCNSFFAADHLCGICISIVGSVIVHSMGHSVSSPTVAKIADFFCFLRLDKHLSLSTIRGYCSALTAVFKFCLPELLDNFVLHDLIRSFELERPRYPVCPPP